MTTDSPLHARSRSVPLVGAHHRELVAQLSAEALSAGQGFRVHLLNGPSGVGKSRIIREVYSAMVHDQTRPHYWPALVEDPDNIVATRKVLGPGRGEFTWTSGALPSFIWWDIACSISDDRNPSEAIATFAPFLRQHLVPASLAVAQSRGLPQNVAAAIGAAWRDMVRDVGSESALEVAGTVIEKIAGLDVLGLGLVVKEVRTAADWLRERQDRQSQLAADVVLDSFRVPLAQSQADLLQAMSAGVLPSVIAIEDLHFMGADTQALLVELQERDADVVVLATAWPEGRNRPLFRDWWDAARDVVHGHDVQPPAPRDAAAMVLSLAPRTTRIEAVRIVEKWTNPFSLLALLSLTRVRRQLERTGGVLVFDENLIDAPEDVAALYQQRLAEVPTPVADSLACAAGSLPSAELELLTVDFMPTTIGQASVRADVGQGSSAAVVQGLESAEKEFHWCRDKGSGLTVFREPMLQIAAHRRLTETQTRDARRRLRQAAKAELEGFIDARRAGSLLLPLDDDVAVAACSWLVELHRSEQ